jgi:hypothetical protein
MSYFLHSKSAALGGRLYLLPRNSKKSRKREGTERLAVNTMQCESDPSEQCAVVRLLGSVLRAVGRHGCPSALISKPTYMRHRFQLREWLQEREAGRNYMRGFVI